MTQDHSVLRLLIRSVFIGLISAGLFAPAYCAANIKGDQLQQKTADIDLLRQQLHERAEQAASIRNALIEQQKTLESEIHFLVKNEKINSFEKAAENPRIHYNIELLRSILAYIDELSKKIHDYQIGRDKLAYLQKSVNDDIKMINTMNDLQIDALMTQISLVVNRYLTDAHIIQLDTSAIQPLDAVAVWKQVVGKSK